jgi:hypothetical protein
VIFRYDVSRTEAGGSIGLLHKEMGMSREDDFDDIIDSPDETDTGQEDTSGVLINETSESSVEEPEEVEIDAIIIEEEEAPPPPSAARKKKKAAKKKVAKKKVAKKKVAKKKVAKKKVAKKKVAKKKTRPAPKKKARRKR